MFCGTFIIVGERGSAEALCTNERAHHGAGYMVLKYSTAASHSTTA